MLSRILLLLFVTTTLTYAEPSLAQVQQAVAKNPGLLNTPQAKAMMAEKGVSLSEVKQKLAETSLNTKQNSEGDTSVVDNNIDTTVEESTQESDTNEEDLVRKVSHLVKNVNPFAYKSNKAIQKSLKSKQQSSSIEKLNRYSLSFYANKNKLDSSSLPTPNDYIMSVGDMIRIHIYGDRDKSYSVEIKNDGTIDLAYIGPIKLGGMKFIDAKKYLIDNLKNHFKMSEFNVNIDKYSTIQVTLIGDVKYPGLYNLSSFATVKDLLIVSKGIRKSASVRDIVVKRDSKVIANLDFYDLLFKGKSFGTILLKHGDIVIINKAKKLVSINGSVNNKAIFELNGRETLKSLIDYAGGMRPDASKSEIKISRYENNAKQKTYKVAYSNSKNFKMKDGDRVYIYPLDFTSKNSINVYGNIIRPGAYNLSKKHTLNDFFKEALKNGKEKFFLPDTYFDYALIKHYGKDLQYSSKSFNILDVISGKKIVQLSANDEVYIYGFNDIYTNSYITTNGKTLIKAGKLQYILGMTIQDAINASGINGVLDDEVRVTTYATEDFMPKTTFYSLESQGSTLLNAYDEIEVFDYYDTHLLEPVTITGEVVKPVSVSYEKNMSVNELLNIAGGFNKKAYTKTLSILRYYVDETQTRHQKVLSFDLSNVSLEDIKLEPYDEVKISKILGWDSQDYETVTIAGEIRNPKTIKYGKGITLEDLVIMAGGLTKKAYSRNIEIVRYSVDENEERVRTILKIDTAKQAFSSIPLEAYDEIRIFKIPKWNEKRSVTLKGEVKFPGIYSIESGEKISSVIERAGGFTNEAFVKGTVFTRESIRRRQISEYKNNLARLKHQLSLFNAMPANAKKAQNSSMATAKLDEVIIEAQKYAPIGRVGIVMDINITKIKEGKYNLVLKNQDTITVPSQIDTITVFGEVFNPTSFVYDDNMDADDYIELASGFSQGADEGRVYVIHADGSSEPIVSGWWIFSSYADIEKGDTIVVPLYIQEYNQLEVWDSVARILASFAITVATINTLGII